MENVTTTAEETKTNVATVSKTKIVEQKYKIDVNKKEQDYHPVPLDIRKHETRGGKISSEFIAIHGMATSAPLRGLTTEQERYFAPKMISKNPKDTGYDEAMTDYWYNFSIDVPARGLELDASYELKKVKIDGEETEIEYPLYLDQYMKAMFAKNCSRVAFTEEDKENNYIKDFIMIDLSVAKKQEVDKFRIRNQAMAQYIDLVKSFNDGKPNERIDFLVEILKDDNENFYGADWETKLKKLEDVSKAKPEEFIKQAVDNKNLEHEALIFKLTRTRLVTLEGDLYFLGDVKIGTKKEFIEFLKDQTKSGEVAKLKAKLNEVIKGKPKV